MLQRLLTEVAFLTRADAAKVYLFGFSGGAQFAHRYAMAHPGRVARAVVAAAGWYTFPDTTQRFPYGIRPVRTLEGVLLDPEQFLRVPIEVLIGSEDTTMHNVRSTERTVAQQGTTRIDRARNWVSAMRKAAAAHSLEPLVTLTEIPGVGHSFADYHEKAELVKIVGRSLFAAGAPTEAVRHAANASKNGTARV
jgi:dienelactone hydrolase